jgi:GntP family gluconate:H+ symporter
VRQKSSDRKQLAVALQTALASAGVIIIITASGGAFGNMLQQTGIGPRIQELAGTYQIAVLPLAFLVTALVRTAQGSATVAMITAVGILAGFSDPQMLGFHPVYLALAIGCGSKPIPWMNDSGFWIISKMSGLTERETLKTFSVALTLMGIAGLLVILILARFFLLV